MPVPLRAGFDAEMVRLAAKRSKDGPQARRLLALAAIYEGASRTEAAKIGGVTLQIVRDGVLKFNAHGPDGLIDRKPPGQAPRLVEPASGATVWYISNAISKPLFELVLADFAASVGAGQAKRIVLQLDNAGWRGPENLSVPDGVRLVHQPPHSPELQPAEHLWPFVDEPLVNGCFKTLDDLDKVVALRCRDLIGQREMIRDSTLFHWRPDPSAMK